MYFCNSIIILNDATTYLIRYALFKFSYIPPFNPLIHYSAFSAAKAM